MEMVMDPQIGSYIEMNQITKADIYNARYTELVKLEEFLKGHIEQLDADYHAKKDLTSHDTVAYYVSKTMCVQFQRQLIKMHSQVTDDQFKGVVK